MNQMKVAKCGYFASQNLVAIYSSSGLVILVVTSNVCAVQTVT